MKAKETPIDEIVKELDEKINRLNIQITLMQNQIDLLSNTNLEILDKLGDNNGKNNNADLFNRR